MKYISNWVYRAKTESGIKMRIAILAIIFCGLFISLVKHLLLND